MPMLTTPLNAATTTIPPHVFQNTFKYNSPQQDIDNALLIGRTARIHHAQVVAATLAAALPNGAIADHPGTIMKVLITNLVAAAAAGPESMTFQVLKNGVGIFDPANLPTLLNASGTGVFDATPFLLPAAAAVGFVHVGDVWTISRVNVNPGGLTFTDVSIDWG